MEAIRTACLLTGGPDRRIGVNGTEYIFENHPQMGPVSHHTYSPDFWDAVSLWSQQGEHVTPDGLCVWLPNELFQKLTPRFGDLWGINQRAREALLKLGETDYEAFQATCTELRLCEDIDHIVFRLGAHDTSST